MGVRLEQRGHIKQSRRTRFVLAEIHDLAREPFAAQQGFTNPFCVMFDACCISWGSNDQLGEAEREAEDPPKVVRNTECHAADGFRALQLH